MNRSPDRVGEPRGAEEPRGAGDPRRASESRGTGERPPTGRPRRLGVALIGLVRLYQWTFSSWLPPRCRYFPSCSNYAVAAIRGHGPVCGGWLALKRFLSCHPWGGSGYDPVPGTMETPKEPSD